MLREGKGAVVDLALDLVALHGSTHAGEVVHRLPTERGWRFEPDWDGLNVVARIGSRTRADRLISDRGRSFDRFFPELVQAIRVMSVGEVIVRGSLIVVGHSGIDHELVRRRLHPSQSRVASLAEATPATLVLTDVLHRGGMDLQASTIDERRRVLERFASEASIEMAPSRLRRTPQDRALLVSPQTFDRRVAHAWLLDRDATGREGVIARHADGRRWVRVRRLRTASCVVTGFRRTGSGEVGAVRLGMYDDGELVDVGRTVALRRAPARRHMAGVLKTVDPVAVTLSPLRSTWVGVPPALACEVRFERVQGRRFRQAATFVRWLPELDPRSCTTEQLSR